MPNTFQTQSLVERGLAFAWKASEGFADRVSFRNDLVPGAVKNTGYSTTLRRPSYGGTTQAGTAVDYSLPGVTQPVAPAAYDTLTDITLPITVSQRFEYNMQVSMEELTFKLSKEDAMKRFIEPAIVDMRDKINYFVSNLVAQSAGQVINTAANTDFPTKGDQFMQGMLQAKALMAYRKGITGNTQPKTALINPNVITNLGMANAKVYHAGFLRINCTPRVLSPTSQASMSMSPRSGCLDGLVPRCFDHCHFGHPPDCLAADLHCGSWWSDC